MILVVIDFVPGDDRFGEVLVEGVFKSERYEFGFELLL
jgi:hypothetical protein